MEEGSCKSEISGFCVQRGSFRVGMCFATWHAEWYLMCCKPDPGGMHAGSTVVEKMRW